MKGFHSRLLILILYTESHAAFMAKFCLAAKVPLAKALRVGDLKELGSVMLLEW